MPSMPTPPPSAQAAAPAPAIATDQVTISNFAFDPASITVKVGTTVTWTNQDQDAHTVSFKSGPDSGKTSQPLQMGDTYQFTFTTAGTISYICSIHPFMHGTVVVTQ
jgi:amicyanin